MVYGTRNLNKGSEYTEDVTPGTKVDNILSSDYLLQSLLEYDSDDSIQQGVQKTLKIMMSKLEKCEVPVK